MIQALHNDHDAWVKGPGADETANTYMERQNDMTAAFDNARQMLNGLGGGGAFAPGDFIDNVPVEIPE
jgi:hypothetical protein